MHYVILVLLTVWTTGRAANGDVTLTQSGNTFTLRNDLVSVYIDGSGEIASLLLYRDGDGNADNSVQLVNASASQKGYFSLANSSGAVGLTVSKVYVKVNTTDMAEVQYAMKEKNGMEWVIGYIMRRGVTGIYNYAVVNGKENTTSYSEARMGVRGDPSLFNYAYVSDDVQEALPTPTAMKNYVEELADATYRLADGTIYTKYNYAAFQKDDYMHGMMGNQIGLWMIAPSVEWVNGGPLRQDLTVHATDTSPIALRHFQGNHFGGVSTTIATGKSKYYGPHLIYINQTTASDVATAHNELIADAKQQTATERAAWPYSWLRDENIKKRGAVSGQISLGSDAAYFNTTRFQVVLAQAGVKPMLQGDGYQFWAETDEQGHFTIDNVRAGSYTLWAYALNGAATGYYEHGAVTVADKQTTALGTLTWSPDKYGQILWQIGEANHLSSGYKLSGTARRFGLWDEVPATMSYTIGTSSAATDWYYAQTKNDNWFVYYQLDEVPSQPLRLTVATAGAANVKMKVRSNETKSSEGVGVFRPAHDGSVSRSATLAGRDSLVVFDIPVSTLKKGQNYLNLNIWGIPDSGMGGIMYDCIKLEADESYATAIRQVRAEPVADDRWYTLQGVQVAAPSHGVYIRNGKKVYIK